MICPPHITFLKAIQVKKNAGWDIVYIFNFNLKKCIPCPSFGGGNPELTVDYSLEFFEKYDGEY